MLEYLRFRWRLAREERMRRKTNAKYQADLTAARARGAKRDEIQEIDSLAFFEDRTYDQDIHRLHTRYLLAEANKLIVPIADWDDEESWEEEDGRHYLTNKGINELRAAIRTEKKLRREQILMWVPAMTAFTGLAGATIGVIAAWFGFGVPSK
jgi:hypothetical protein